MEIESRHELIDISVIMSAYFHEDYVGKALDSVLAQDTNLRLEVLITDDASQDRTQDILRDYAARYPALIKPILRQRNIGATKNGWDLRRRAKGRYLAFLGGDDFWLAPNKLQKQWEFLQNHPEYSGCCGKSLIVNEDDQPNFTQSPHFVWNKKIFTLQDFIDSWNIPGQTSTLMCRNIFRYMEPEDYSITYRAHPQVGDKTLMLFLLAEKPIYCSNEILSAYRYVDKTGEHNWFSIHHDNPYRNYDMFMYPCRLETWARGSIGLPYSVHLGQRSHYRFCRFVEECVKSPSIKRMQYLAKMILHSHQPLKYSYYAVKALIEME